MDEEAQVAPEKDDSSVTENVLEATSGGFVRDVWYGQRSLAQTFWFWNFLIGGLLINLLGAFVVGTIAGATGVLILVYMYIGLVTLPYAVWITVGLWRSATNNPGFWAVVVKILAVVGVLYLVVSMMAGVAELL